MHKGSVDVPPTYYCTEDANGQASENESNQTSSTESEFNLGDSPPKIISAQDDPINIHLERSEAITLLSLIAQMKNAGNSNKIVTVEYPLLVDPKDQTNKDIVPLEDEEQEEQKGDTVKLDVKPSIYDAPIPIAEDRMGLPRTSYKIINRVGFVCCNVLMLFILEEYCRSIYNVCKADGNWSRMAIVGLMPLAWFFTIFSINCMWGALLSFIGPLHQCKQNSPFYSIIPPKITKENMPEKLSTVMIQVPVYKESFKDTIKLTLENTLEAVREYSKHNGKAVVFVNDDGLVYLSKEEQKERIDFYNENGIYYVARPTNEVLKRRGCFKKASNMNFCLNVMMETQEIFNQFKQGKDTQDITIDQEMTESEQKDSILQQLAKRDHFMANKALEMCDYILLIDSDSRIPYDCLLPVTVELNESPNIAFTQHLTYMMSVSGDYWEKLISHFTDRINQNAILLSTASGETAPFMGHNAFLRWSSLLEVSFIDKRDKKKKIWAENRVSEDFDLAIRLYRKGLMGRYIAYGKGFEEGVALIVRDEITRLQKYAYGCCEVLCNSVTNFHKKGLIGTPFRRLLGSKVQLATKYNILCYIGTWMALSSGPVLAMANYWLWYVPAYHETNSIAYTWLTMIFIFGIFTPSGCVVMSYRTGMKPRIVREFIKELVCGLGMILFWSGVSFHIMLTVWQYIWGIKPTWGATTKEVYEDTNFFVELKKTILTYKLMYSWVILSVAIMLVMAYIPPLQWRITDFSCWFPLAYMVTAHALMPILLNPALTRVFY